MHRRHQHINIPTEIVRTIAVISETGSFSKAGERLGLSQPAISAQVKRLQILVGGPVFQKTAGGIDFTPRGKLVLAQARKILEANDQILSLGGAVHDAQPVRVGLSTLYVEEFLAIWRQQRISTPLHFFCDHPADLAKGLSEGFLDIACIFNPPPDIGEMAVEWQEDFAWVRKADFVLSPGAPIPLVSWPGSLADYPYVSALDRAGLAYRVVFASADHHARIAAAKAGVGLMGLPVRQIEEPLAAARDYYLPPLAPVRAGIALRPGLTAKEVDQVVDALSRLSMQSIEVRCKA